MTAVIGSRFERFDRVFLASPDAERSDNGCRCVAMNRTFNEEFALLAECGVKVVAPFTVDQVLAPYKKSVGDTPHPPAPGHSVSRRRLRLRLSHGL